MSGKTPTTVLVIEDERKIADLVRTYLERDGYRVLLAADGQQGVELALREHPALIILDLMLPKLSGLDVCRQVRQQSSVPIIMLTARAEEVDKLIGLEMGADDYVTKPFSPRELVARVRAVLRRAAAPATSEVETLVRGDLQIDLARHEVRLAGRLIDLTPTEFALLVVLARSPGRVYSRLQLLEQAVGDTFEGYERTVDAHIKGLRRKLGDDPARPRYIATVYGVGYRFEGQAG